MADNKHLAARFVAYLEASDHDGLLSILSPDTVWWDAIRGELDNMTYLDAVRQFGQLYASPLKLTTHGMTAENDRVAIEMESLVTLSNGKIYNNRYHILLELEGDKIIKVKEYMDTQHVVEIIDSLT